MKRSTLIEAILLCVVAILILVGFVALLILPPNYFKSHDTSAATTTAQIATTTASTTANTPQTTVPSPLVYFQYTNTNDLSGGDNGLREDLMKKDFSTGLDSALMTFKGAKDDVYPVSHISLYKNNLYFINRSGALNKLDAKLNELTNPEIGLQAGEFVSDYLFVDNILYYLAGPFCDTYRGECHNSLRSVELSSGQVETLYTDLSSSVIGGLNGEKTKLYFFDGFGDAGCMAEYKTEFDLAAKTSVTFPQISLCEEDSDYDQKEKAIKDFHDALVPKKSTTRFMSWDGSYLTPSNFPSNDSSVTLIDVY
jgi:hypothetical protein